MIRARRPRSPPALPGGHARRSAGSRAKMVGDGLAGVHVAVGGIAGDRFTDQVRARSPPRPGTRAPRWGHRAAPPQQHGPASQQDDAGRRLWLPISRLRQCGCRRAGHIQTGQGEDFFPRGLADGPGQIVNGHRLVKVAEHPQPPQFQGRLHRSEAGEHDDRDLGPVDLHLLEVAGRPCGACSCPGSPRRDPDQARTIRTASSPPDACSTS